MPVEKCIDKYTCAPLFLSCVVTVGESKSSSAHFPHKVEQELSKPSCGDLGRICHQRKDLRMAGSEIQLSKRGFVAFEMHIVFPLKPQSRDAATAK
jgi:hypothetical protein